MTRILVVAMALQVLSPTAAHGQDEQALTAAARIDTVLKVGETHRYSLALRRGESADLVVVQRSVDVIVEVRGANDSLLAAVDSPNGRSGPEPVEIIAGRTGRYVVRVRPFDGREPSGAYTLEVRAIRDVRRTSAELARRREQRERAARWLAQRGAAIDLATLTQRRLPLLDSVAVAARVVGLGEATHGSRELNDARTAVTQYLIRFHGYRLVAIEASMTKLAILNAYTQGRAGDDALKLVESGWIGRRALRELVGWLRTWNQSHPGDMVNLIGLDAQDFESGRATLSDFLPRAYGPVTAASWERIDRVLAAADSQSARFANSNVDSLTRGAILQLRAILQMDAPALRRLYGDSVTAAALLAADALAQFADYNAGIRTPASRSRDWYMAANLLAAMERHRGSTVLWAHNAHIAHPAGSRTTGAVLRNALGCNYRAIATLFGSGAFVAQLAGAPDARLIVDSLPAAPETSLDHVASRAFARSGLSGWRCGPDPLGEPEWLSRPQPMHFIVAVWDPANRLLGAFQPVDLLREFDAAIYIDRVTAEELPAPVRRDR